MAIDSGCQALGLQPAFSVMIMAVEVAPPMVSSSGRMVVWSAVTIRSGVMCLGVQRSCWLRQSRW